MATNFRVDGVHWQAGSELHITVCYVGEVSDKDVDRLRSSLGRISIAPFRVAVKGMGVFDSEGGAVHLWAGLQPRAELEALHTLVKRQVEALGINIAHFRYQPHITLARLASSAAGSVDDFLESNRDLCTRSFEVSEIGLFRSIPGKFKSIYHCLDTFPLSGTCR
ncbi:RNA 2',3'-cyclic phosphodiesterase [Marinobacter sp. MIT932201]|uniref:RNA 2',3'-cyclic phosphodiesterase n=1 Tax=Marinobacter sp. MIT932201 TaxID=3096995 RepID=UPI00399B278C